MSGIFDKTMSWIQVFKALPFDGGPSTTKWVYLRVAEVVSLCEIMFAASTSYVYWKTGHIDPSMMALNIAIITALFGFASNTKNQQQTLSAQLQSGVVPNATSSTPLSSDSDSKKGTNG